MHLAHRRPPAINSARSPALLLLFFARAPSQISTASAGPPLTRRTAHRSKDIDTGSGGGGGGGGGGRPSLRFLGRQSCSIDCRPSVAVHRGASRVSRVSVNNRSHLLALPCGRPSPPSQDVQAQPRVVCRREQVHLHHLRRPTVPDPGASARPGANATAGGRGPAGSPGAGAVCRRHERLVGDREPHRLGNGARGPVRPRGQVQ